MELTKILIKVGYWTERPKDFQWPKKGYSVVISMSIDKGLKDIEILNVGRLKYGLKIL